MLFTTPDPSPFKSTGIKALCGKVCHAYILEGVPSSLLALTLPLKAAGSPCISLYLTKLTVDLQWRRLYKARAMERHRVHLHPYASGNSTRILLTRKKRYDMEGQG